MTKINGDTPNYPKESGNGKVPLKKEEFYDISKEDREELLLLNVTALSSFPTAAILLQ